MKIWAAVPVKPFAAGKSRLANLMDDQERFELNRRLFVNTLDIIFDLQEIEQVIVVSRDPVVLQVGRERGGLPLKESGDSDLNNALELASDAAGLKGADAVLVIPADLPAVHSSDIRQVLAAFHGSPAVVIVPDRHRMGTNALLLTLPKVLNFSFGGGSFRRHCEGAFNAGAELNVVENFGLSFDIDNPEDLSIARIPEGDRFSILNN
jgi:2-phospho-L-lactate guanylyltransferase